MLNKAQKEELKKKLEVLKKAQEERYKEMCEKLHLNKKGDKVWEKFTAKRKKYLRAWLKREYKLSRKHYTNELNNNL